ncbi:MAG TPA: ATP-binding cassette domain-containing protein, partial [Acidimicrobiales bacterium]|nr:ATP-binding cassette domain-containing protein [Acidimicrobiales bacterium]
NGAGKSTTMRVIMGLDYPTSGQTMINGTPYGQHRWPLREVGALLDARAFHPGRSAFNHLFALAQSNGIARKRVNEVLGLVGLESVAKQRAGGFSMGMGQRLGIAAAMLGDPGVLLFDEPVNGLDPEGILWVRNLLRSLAAEGRTVFVSSHLMSEMALTADHVVVVGRGHLIDDAPTSRFIGRSAQSFVRVRSPQLDRLADALRAKGATVAQHPDNSLAITEMGCEQVGDLAADNNLTIHELVLHEPSLEAAYMELTKDDVEFRANVPNSAPQANQSDLKRA